MTADEQRSYFVVEIFRSLQGEGVRAGCPSIFVRFAGCNVNCRVQTHGFDCDTDHAHGKRYSAQEIVAACRALAVADEEWIVLTGGEPLLQIDVSLLSALVGGGFKLAIETNGTVALGPMAEFIDWICVSPKTPDAQVLQRSADEVKFVVKAGDPLPATKVMAKHYLLSPAWEVDVKGDPLSPGRLPSRNLEHAITLALTHPQWRISTQQHKLWRIR